MRTLTLHFPDDALPTLDTFLKQTKEAGSSAVPKPCAEWSKAAPPNRLRHTVFYLFRAAQVGPSLCPPGPTRPRRPPTLWATAESHVRVGTAPPAPHRSRPLQHGSIHSQWSCRELATVLAVRLGFSWAAKVSAVC